MTLRLHLAQPMLHVETLLSETDGFQTLTGAPDAATAKDSIHYYAAEDVDHGTAATEKAKPFPRAIVALGDYSGTGPAATKRVSTGIILRLEKEILPANQTGSIGSRYLAWLQETETIIDDLWEKALTGSVAGILLNITSIELSIAPQSRSTDDNEGAEIWGSEINIGITT